MRPQSGVPATPNRRGSALPVSAVTGIASTAATRNAVVYSPATVALASCSSNTLSTSV